MASHDFLVLLADASIKGAMLLAAAGLVTLAMRRHSAALRHLVWLSAIVSTLALPMLSVLLPAWRILPRWPERSGTATVETPRAELPSAPQAIAERPMVEPSGRAEASHSEPTLSVAANTDMESLPVTAAPPAWWTRFNWEQGATVIWVVGMALLSLRYMLGLVFVWRIGRKARRVEDEGWLRLVGETSRVLRVRRRVTLLESPRHTIPMTWGVLRPVILLPAETGSWPAERRHAVLLHELAHVKRRDCVAQLVVQFARALYWFNPLMWLAWRRLLVESERACDDLVLTQGSKASDYAEHLLTVASGSKADALLSSAAIAMARPSQLQGRLLAILDEKQNRRRLTRLATAGALLVVVGVVVPLSVLKAVEENQDGANLDADKALANSEKTAPLADQVADRFAGCLASLKLSFLTEARLGAIRKDVRDLADKFAPKGMPPVDKERLLAGVDRYVARQFPKQFHLSARSFEEEAYLQLPDKVRTFEWVLWVALTRKPLSPELSKVRDRQQKWLREFLESVSVRPGDGVPILGMTPKQVRPWAMAQLEQQFSDPLSLLSDPMTDTQFQNFKRIMGNSARNGLSNTVGEIAVCALQARVQLHPATADQTFDMPLPFDDKPLSVYGGAGFVLFASNDRYHVNGFSLDGWREDIGTGGRKSFNRTVFDAIGGTRLQVPAEIVGAEPSATAIVQWLDRQGKGELAYLDGPATLQAVRGAKCAILAVDSWMDADKVSDADLRNLIAAKGQTSISVALLRPVNGKRRIGTDDPRIFVAIESREKRLAVALLQNREFRQLYFGCRARPTSGSATGGKPAPTTAADLRADDQRPWAKAVSAAMPDYEVEHCDSQPSLTIGLHHAYRIVLRKSEKEYHGTGQQRASADPAEMPFVLRYRHIELVAVTDTGVTTNERDKIGWRQWSDDLPYFKKTVHCGRGLGLDWFANATVLDQELLRERLKLEGGDDRLGLLTEALLVDDKGSWTRMSCEHILAKAGDQAIPYIKTAVAEQTNGAKAIYALAFVQTPAATAYLQSLYASDATRNVAAYALIHTPLRQSAKDQYLDMLRRRLRVFESMQACVQFQWKDALPLVSDIYLRPHSLDEFRQAFEAKRRLEGRPIAEEINQAQQNFNYAASEEEYERFEDVLLTTSDTESAIVVAIYLFRGGKIPTREMERATRLGGDVLRQLPRKQVEEVLSRLIHAFEAVPSMQPTAKELSEILSPLEQNTQGTIEGKADKAKLANDVPAPDRR